MTEDTTQGRLIGDILNGLRREIQSLIADCDRLRELALKTERESECLRTQNAAQWGYLRELEHYAKGTVRGLTIQEYIARAKDLEHKLLVTPNIGEIEVDRPSRAQLKALLRDVYRYGVLPIELSNRIGHALEQKRAE